jgi:hypothetical protein
MAASDATIIIAHERVFVESGFEFRGGGAKESPLNECALPTVWNHIEAILAIEAKHPLLVLCEPHIRPEGMLEPIGTHYIHRIEFEAEYLESEEFSEILAQWRQDIERRSGVGRRISRAFSESLLDGVGAIAPIIGVGGALLGFTFWLGSMVGGAS